MAPWTPTESCKPANCCLGPLKSKGFGFRVSTQMVVSQNRGPQYRPLNTIIPLIKMDRMVPLILGNPHPYKPLYNHSFHFIFHFLFHLILHCSSFHLIFHYPNIMSSNSPLVSASSLGPLVFATSVRNSFANLLLSKGWTPG